MFLEIKIKIAFNFLMARLSIAVLFLSRLEEVYQVMSRGFFTV